MIRCQMKLSFYAFYKDSYIYVSLKLFHHDIISINLQVTINHRRDEGHIDVYSNNTILVTLIHVK